MPRTLDVKRIVIHHTGGSTLAGALSTLQQRGLSYHYIIDGVRGDDGNYMNLVDPSRVAYHARNANGDSVGISFVGNFLTLGYPSDAQIETAKRIIRTLWLRFGETFYSNVNQAMVPHNAVGSTACPAFNIQELRDYLYDLMYPDTLDSIESSDDLSKYQKVEDIPEWGRDAVEWAIDRGYLKGEETGNLGISDNLLRTIVMLKRINDDKEN